MKPQRLAPWLILSILVLIAALVWGYRPSPLEAARRITCADLAAGCDAQLSRSPVRIVFEGEVKALTPFTVRVEAPGVRSARARFDMEGMDMGFNLYTLRPAADGVFQARVTLPVCVTGRRDWEMTLYLDEETILIPFVTEL